MSSLQLATDLNRAVSHLMRAMRHIDDAQGIGRARLSALAVLVFGGPRTMSALAEAEMVSPATMHHIVNGLLEEGLITRQPHDSDARKFILAPTRTGNNFMRRAQADRLAFLQSGIDQATAPEVRALATVARVFARWA